MTEHLADGLHRHTCLQRNEAGERVSSRMVEIDKDVKMTQRYARVTPKKAHPSFRQD